MRGEAASAPTTTGMSNLLAVGADHIREQKRAALVLGEARR